ncbi:MAG: CCA tRNA nucleotidyltransferase [Candidatus Aenigmarchaeota archaeon]|nr:CCA tRNA nucleotidyltransferase [Candidatus Aenigmarchaeota archaeon]
MAFENVIAAVLAEITPSQRERDEFSAVLDSIESAADVVIKPLRLEKTIAGSFIRDTWLADKKEMDLFIMFPVSYSRERLEKTGLEVGKKIIRKLKGKYAIAYAEHPYVKGVVKGFSVDIVPCYKVESASKIKSAVDRTPFHNMYILENLKPAMAADVRLLKQFCKAMDVYGSDIRTLGFSGYLCELLIINYKNFTGLAATANKWKYGTFIDLQKHGAPPSSERFKGQPLVVIDPTDPKRNVAASLSEENFLKFIDGCRNFMKKPVKSFFHIKKIPLKPSELIKILKGRGTEVLFVEFKRPNVVDDILWSQMRKTASRLKKLMQENDFNVTGHDVWSDEKKSYLMFELDKWELPELTKLVGPPVTSEQHSAEFRRKYKALNVYDENGRWAVNVRRKYRVPDVLIKSFLKKTRKMLINEGVRSYVAGGISKGFRLLKKDEAVKLAGKNEGFAVFLKKYFEREA